MSQPYLRDRDRTRARLRQRVPNVVPSLLACDFAILQEEIAAAEQVGCVAVQWDVMDGHFVPNLTYGPPVLKSLRPKSPLVFDAHLMIAEPAKYLDDFLDAGCDSITVHLETFEDRGVGTALVERVKQAGALAGVALNPPTPVEAVEPYLGLADLVLVMGVMPGFGGQAFDEAALYKLRWVREHSPAATLVQVDGGVNRTTIRSVVEAGADQLVVGSAFYGASDRAAALANLERAMTDQPPLEE